MFGQLVEYMSELVIEVDYSSDVVEYVVEFVTEFVAEYVVEYVSQFVNEVDQSSEVVEYVSLFVIVDEDFGMLTGQLVDFENDDWVCVDYVVQNEFVADFEIDVLLVVV